MTALGTTLRWAHLAADESAKAHVVDEEHLGTSEPAACGAAPALRRWSGGTGQRAMCPTCRSILAKENDKRGGAITHKKRRAV